MSHKIMENSWDGVQLAHLMQRIILLYYLNHTPEEPTDNWALRARDQGQTESNLRRRVLSLRQERRIAEAFVLLAACSDDPKRVMAACVQEGEDGQSMIIKLAVNNGGLDEVQKRLQKIGNLLQQLRKKGNGERADAHLALLREAVSLNQNRILCRLRSKHAALHCNFKKEKKARPTWVLRLCDTIQHLDSSAIQTHNTQEIEALQSDANHLKLLYQSLEALDRKEARSTAAIGLLVAIAGICDSLYSRLTLKSVLGMNSGADVQAIKKVNRYTSISKLLVQYSCQLPVFENINIEAVRVTATACQKVELEPFVLSAIQEISNTPRRKVLIAKSKRNSQSGIEDSILHASLHSYPIHAEIQLLFHYEGSPAETLAPRVICSNKQACFLCNLFFKIHGRFLIPGSHGNFYEKWALPAGIAYPGRFPGVIERLQIFSEEIGNRINREIQLQRKPFKAPYESTIFPSGVESVNTTLSLKRPERYNHTRQEPVRRDSLVIIGNSLSDPSEDPEEPVEPLEGIPRLSSTSVMGPLQSSLSSQQTLQGEVQEDLPTLKPTAGSSATTPIIRHPQYTSPAIKYHLNTIGSSEEAILGNFQLPSLPNSLSTPPSGHEFAEEMCSRSKSTSACSADSRSRSGFSLDLGEPIKLQRGIPISRIVSSLRRSLVVHTAKMHLTLFCYSGYNNSEHWPAENSTQEDIEGTKSFCVCIEWLSEGDCALISGGRKSQHIIEIESLPEGLDMVEEFRQAQWPREIYLKRGQELLLLSFMLVHTAKRSLDMENRAMLH